MGYVILQTINIYIGRVQYFFLAKILFAASSEDKILEKYVYAHED